MREADEEGGGSSEEAGREGGSEEGTAHVHRGNRGVFEESSERERDHLRVVAAGRGCVLWERVMRREPVRGPEGAGRCVRVLPRGSDQCTGGCEEAV